MHLWQSFGMIGTVLLWMGCSSEHTLTQQVDWPHYQGDPGSNQYSPLGQVTRDNVAELEIAWTYHSGDLDSSAILQIQCNPLIVGGVLYGTSPSLKLFALDARTGEELWVYDPSIDAARLAGMGVNRGLAYWSDGEEERIFYGAGSYLHSVDLRTGTADRAFGAEGKVDLHLGLGDWAQDLFVLANTPGVIFEDLLILGTRVNEAMGAAPGYVRALDVRTGALVWTFHTIPLEGEEGYDTWPSESIGTMGGANAWSGMSVDHTRGIVFVPTGSAAYDFYGGDRHGENLFANCLLALDARSGKRIWHFQTIRHDVWDRDLPAPPNLVTVQHDGRQIDAVAQITKAGYVFLFDRESGQPLFPIREVAADPSDLEGESTWPSQPVPTRPPRFSRGSFEENDLTQRTPEAHAFVRAIWQSLRKGKEFIPPSEEGTILLPGFDGGGEWGGASVDPNGIMYINASEMPWIIKMIKYQPVDDGLLATRGKNLYGTHCQLCHGADLKGASIYTVPSLEGLTSRLTTEEITHTIRNGKGMMPSFQNLSDGTVQAIVAFLTGSREKIDPDDEVTRRDEWQYPYFMSGYVRFKDHEGYPALTPPWGTLNAIDLNEGTIKWKVTLGEHPELVEAGLANTGSENYGGPVSTAGGLVFIAGTVDSKIRAFDQADGALLWEHALPTSGFSTPSIYAVDGTQYIVQACGGGKLGVASGDAYVAFALKSRLAN